MKKLMPFPMILTIALGFAQGCHKQASQDQSESKVIATNYDENGDPQPMTHIYWVNSTYIFRGECHEGGLPLRSKCSYNMQSMPYGTFKTALDNGLSATIRELEMQVVDLRSLIAAIEAEMVATLQEIHRQQVALQVSEAELAEVVSEMERLETWLTEINFQLHAIEEELQNAPDSDLEEVAAQYALELTSIRNRLGQVYREIPQIQRRIASIQSRLSQLNQEFVHLMATLVHFSEQLQQTLEALEQARHDLGNYQRTLANLESFVIYPVTTRFDSLFGDIKPFVRRFDVIFTP